MSTATRLRAFRQSCERQTGLPADAIEVSLLHVLADVSDALGLSPRERRHVLGRKGAQALRDYREQRASARQ